MENREKWRIAEDLAKQKMYMLILIMYTVMMLMIKAKCLCCTMCFYFVQAVNNTSKH